MRFGIVSDCYGLKVPLEESVRRLAEIGYKDLEVPGGHLLGGAGNPPSAKAVEKKILCVKQIIADCGMKIWQAHGSYGGLDLVADTEKERQANLTIYKRWLDCFLLLGAETLIVHIGGRHDFCSRRDTPFIRDTNVDSLRRLLDHIGGENLRLAIENLLGPGARKIPAASASNIYGNRIRDLLEIIKLLGPDKVGICLDTGHANVEGIDIPAAVAEIGRYLIATHIHENDGHNDLHLFPFSMRKEFSNMDWSAILRAFRNIDYPYPLIGECANTTGELPLEMTDFYLKNQKKMIEMFIAGLPG